jgi:tripartite-type tricarboxylate transporter receptor subunit TctC
MLHVPYRGGAPAAQALITNEVQFSAIDAVTALPLMRAGSVRAIAVSSARRAALMPEVPTVAESGLPGFESSTDFSMFAPAGTPEDIVRRLHAANVAALRAPEVKERLDSLAIEAVGGTPEEFAAYQRREMEKWGRIIRERNIKAG